MGLKKRNVRLLPAHDGSEKAFSECSLRSRPERCIGIIWVKSEGKRILELRDSLYEGQPGSFWNMRGPEDGLENENGGEEEMEQESEADQEGC